MFEKSFWRENSNCKQTADQRLEKSDDFGAKIQNVIKNAETFLIHFQTVCQMICF